MMNGVFSTLHIIYEQEALEGSWTHVSRWLRLRLSGECPGDGRPGALLRVGDEPSDRDRPDSVHTGKGKCISINS